MLRIGVGWEIVVLSAPLPVAERAGNYSVQIAIPELPLAPGSYSLNVFLSRRKLHREDAGAVLDMRSWTIGNGYRLQVEGPVMAAAARLPFEVRRPEAIS
jgi:lipopolysaccharide transport system ATP-binding protein